jgi:hypothetical protein
MLSDIYLNCIGVKEEEERTGKRYDVTDKLEG